MKNLIIIAVIAYAGYYYFNKTKSQCETLQDVKDRAYELTKALVHAGTSRNSNLNADSLMQKIKNLENMKNSGFNDIPGACRLMDELMDELDY